MGRRAVAVDEALGHVGVDRDPTAAGSGIGHRCAAIRVVAALLELGPDLSDRVALRQEGSDGVLGPPGWTHQHLVEATVFELAHELRDLALALLRERHLVCLTVVLGHVCQGLGMTHDVEIEIRTLRVERRGLPRRLFDESEPQGGSKHEEAYNAT